MAGLGIDVSDVLIAAAEIGAKGAAAESALEPVMAKAALNIKTGMQDAFNRSPHFRQIARTVSYDRIGLLTGTLGYEVGPTVGGAGSLAGIAVEGGARGGGGTVDIQPAMDAEAPRLEAALMVALGLL